MTTLASTTGVRRAARPKRRSGRISLTPLVDVVFILVIFFMLASTFTRTNSVELITPKSGGAGAVSAETLLLVTLLGDERFDIQGTAQDADGLKTRLSEAGDRRVVVKTGDGTDLQDVVFFLDLSARLGLKNIAFAADPAHGDRRGD